MPHYTIHYIIHCQETTGHWISAHHMSHYNVCTAGIPMVTLLGVTECLITSDSTDVSCQKYMRWRTEGLSSSLCESSAWNTMMNFPRVSPVFQWVNPSYSAINMSALTARHFHKTVTSVLMTRHCLSLMTRHFPKTVSSVLIVLIIH